MDGCRGEGELCVCEREECETRGTARALYARGEEDAGYSPA